MLADVKSSTTEKLDVADLVELDRALQAVQWVEAIKTVGKQLDDIWLVVFFVWGKRPISHGIIWVAVAILLDFSFDNILTCHRPWNRSRSCCVWEANWWFHVQFYTQTFCLCNYTIYDKSLWKVKRYVINQVTSADLIKNVDCNVSIWNVTLFLYAVNQLKLRIVRSVIKPYSFNFDNHMTFCHNLGSLPIR